MPDTTGDGFSVKYTVRKQVLIPIDFFKYRHLLRLREKDGKRFVFDPIRQKDILLQPEEWVRQLVILFLIEELKYNRNRFRVELMLKVNQLTRRCDVLIYDHKMSPWMLIECKSAEVPLSQAVFDQIARYNLPLKVPFLLVTNGLSTCCCSMNYQDNTYEFIPQLPPWPMDA